MSNKDQQFAIDAYRVGLTAEYEEWLRLQNLTLGSADEHLFDERLTADQRLWLCYFSRRWDDMETISQAWHNGIKNVQVFDHAFDEDELRAITK